MKLNFTTKDFNCAYDVHAQDIAMTCANAAQMKFDEWLAQQPVIYAVGSTDRIESIQKLLWSQETAGNDHYKARLVNIEELEDE